MDFNNSKDKCVTLTSDSDEDPDEKLDSLPKIIDAVSLQGCSSAFSFTDQPVGNDDDSILYTHCDIKEDKSEEKNNSNKEINNRSKEIKDAHKEKKRIKPIHLGKYSSKQENGPITPGSKHNKEDVVVGNKQLALQESLFKTKELFDTFLRICQDLDNSAEMQKVVEKLERAYNLTRQDFLGSAKFQSILEEETEKVNISNMKPWLNLKLVLDELKYNKKNSATKLKLGESEDSHGTKSSDEEPTIECVKKRRHLKRLEKTLRVLNLKIQQLEEKEVNLNDEDSSYVKMGRYREQFTKIYNKVCEIKGKLPDADRPYLRKISFTGTKHPHINRCIERYYNKRREFPDFHDIEGLVVKASDKDLAPIKIHSIAQAAFREFGEMLKRLRQFDDYDIIINYLKHHVDPADGNPELQEKLNKNSQLFRKREQEVLDKFADIQERGEYVESDEGSDSKPKKKRRIMIKSDKQSSASKKLLSSSECSDDSSDEKGSVKAKQSDPLLESSSESSGEGSKKVKDKGKRLLGKKTIVKRGLKVQECQASTSKQPRTHSAISSDEESNSIDTFTNYLGLHMTPKKDNTKVEEKSDDEVILVLNKKKIPVSSGSETDIDSKPVLESGSSKTSDSNKNVNGTRKKQDDSDVKQGTAVKKTSLKGKQASATRKVMKTSNGSENRRKQNGLVELNVQRSTKGTSICSDKITLSSDSDDESAERTSADESEFSAKRSGSGASKAMSLELSGDSSKQSGKDSDIDDSIVILSEDMMEVKSSTKTGPEPKNNTRDSDSDNDILILSQSSSETRSVAPTRRIQPSNQPRRLLTSRKSTTGAQNSNQPQRQLTSRKSTTGAQNSNQPRRLLTSSKSTTGAQNSNQPQRQLTSSKSTIGAQNRNQPGRVLTGFTSSPLKRPLTATSTPKQNSNRMLVKTKGPNQMMNGVIKKPRKMELSGSQVMNGASRKTLVHCPGTIPLIELD